jgi:hypothetical protein
MKHFLLVLIATTIVGFLLGFMFLNFSKMQALTNISTTDLTRILDNQNLGSVWLNPIKYMIRGAMTGGVAPKTVSLLLLLTVVTAFIAAVRHLVGVRSFGIFMPAALSVVFVSIGPILGIGLFILIIAIASLVRFTLRRFKIHLQYLPRMALILWGVIICVMGFFFIVPFVGGIDLSGISVLPLFILILLAEDFIRVQLGKSVKAAATLTTETLIISYMAFLILSFVPFEEFALLNPEILLLTVAVFDFILGKYIGLRFLEYYRFRKLIRS